MTFEEIITRYNSGETDLKGETLFILQNQGKEAAFDFARAVDEAAGSNAYNAVMLFINEYQQKQSEPKFNEQEAMKSALKKAEEERNKAFKMQENERMAENITATKNAPALPLAQPIKRPIFDYVRPNTPTEKGGFVAHVFDTERKTWLYIITAIIVIGSILYLTRKK